MAAQFCLNWLKQNRTENEATFGHSSSVQSIDTSHQVGGNEPTQPDEIIFENTDFKLIVKTDQIRRSHRFQIVDRQFNLLIVPKNIRTVLVSPGTFAIADTSSAQVSLLK